MYSMRRLIERSESVNSEASPQCMYVTALPLTHLAAMRALLFLSGPFSTPGYRQGVVQMAAT